MITFNLKGEYIELVKLLKITNLASTGGHAKIMVENGEVKRNGVIETRKRAKIKKHETLLVNGTEITVI